MNMVLGSILLAWILLFCLFIWADVADLARQQLLLEDEPDWNVLADWLGYVEPHVTYTEPNSTVTCRIRGDEVARVVTRHQQRRARRNPAQRRGPTA